MTVKELIEELEHYPDDTVVEIVLNQKHPMRFEVGDIEEPDQLRVQVWTGTELGY